MQYSIFSVILGSLITLTLTLTLLAVFPPNPPPPPLTVCKILDTRVQHCLWGKGEEWACVNWKTPQKCKSVPRHLSMIVGIKRLSPKSDQFKISP